jgi:hypothetical protein
MRRDVKPLEKKDELEEMRMLFAKTTQYVPSDITVIDVMAKMLVTNVLIRAVRDPANPR